MRFAYIVIFIFLCTSVIGQFYIDYSIGYLHPLVKRPAPVPSTYLLEDIINKLHKYECDTPSLYLGENIGFKMCLGYRFNNYFQVSVGGEYEDNRLFKKYFYGKNTINNRTVRNSYFDMSDSTGYYFTDNTTTDKFYLNSSSMLTRVDFFKQLNNSSFSLGIELGLNFPLVFRDRYSYTEWNNSEIGTYNKTKAINVKYAAGGNISYSFCFEYQYKFSPSVSLVALFQYKHLKFSPKKAEITYGEIVFVDTCGIESTTYLNPEVIDLPTDLLEGMYNEMYIGYLENPFNDYTFILSTCSISIGVRYYIATNDGK